MNKRFLFTFMLGCLLSVDANAGIKFGIPDTVQRVFGTVQTKVQEVVKKVNSTAKSFEEGQIGTSIKTAYEKAKALKQDISNTVDAGKEMYDNAKENVEGAVAAGKDLYNEAQESVTNVVETGQNLYNEAQEGVASVVETGQGLYNEAEGVYEEQMASLEQEFGKKSTVTLQNELDLIDEQLAACGEVSSDELKAKLANANENKEILRQLYETETDPQAKGDIAALLSEAESLSKQYEEALAAGDYAQNNENYQALLAQRQQTETQLAEAKSRLESKGFSLAKSYADKLVKMSAAEKGALYGGTINANFVGPNDSENHATVSAIMTERKEKLKDAIANALVQLIMYRAKSDVVDDEIDRISGNMSESDYLITVESLQNEQAIQKIRLLTDDFYLDTAEFMLTTASDMMKSPVKSPSAGQDPTQMSMDNYLLTKDSIEEAVKESGIE